jgi:hypothetical protein
MGKARKKKHPGTATSEPSIHAASLGSFGSVIKGDSLTKVEAVERRRQGQDVVVCGSNLKANKRLAKGIEGEAIGDIGKVKTCPRIQTPGQKHFRIVNRPIAPRKVTRFMKPNTEKFPMPEYRMKFFTPELYVRYNSPDEDISA